MEFGKVSDLNNVFSVLSFTWLLLGSVIVIIGVFLALQSHFAVPLSSTHVPILHTVSAHRNEDKYVFVHAQKHISFMHTVCTNSIRVVDTDF